MKTLALLLLTALALMSADYDARKTVYSADNFYRLDINYSRADLSAPKAAGCQSICDWVVVSVRVVHIRRDRGQPDEIKWRSPAGMHAIPPYILDDSVKSAEKLRAIEDIVREGIRLHAEAGKAK